MTKIELLALLKRDISEWNQWRNGQTEATVDLEDEDISGYNLQGANLSEINLRGANLSDVNLQWADLTEANLEGADLTSANLKGANLTEANFEGANINYSHMQGADFTGANLRGLHFIDADLHESIFTEANLQGADLDLANLQKANLSYANLEGVELVHSNLRQANLTVAVLAGANLLQATVDNADLSYANLQRVILRGANLQNTNLQEADLEGADLKNANLQGADLHGANLADADLRNAVGIVLNSTFTRNARFDIKAKDRWSVLRQSYTGPRMLWTMLALIAATIPYIVKVLYWSAVNRSQLLQYDAGNSNIGCVDINCHEYYVWELAIGLDKGFVYAIVPITLIIYNIVRAILTRQVAALRDEEERSGYSPELTGERFWQGYKPLYSFHLFAKVLSILALLTFSWNAYYWLTQSVWIVNF